MNQDNQSADRPPGASERAPVLIAGAGPTGLTLSILLSRKGIRNVVAEKRDRIGTLPRARGINVRSVEILAQAGLGEELAASALPPEWIRNFIYTETLAGEIIGVMPTTMSAHITAAYSPCAYCVAAQDRLDPMLYQRATGFNECEVRLGTEVTGYREEADGIVATLRRSDGTTSEFRADYLLAADGGGSPLRQLAGIQQTGQFNLRCFVNVHMLADLGAFTNDREGTLLWTLAPGLEGVFQPLDGRRKWAVQIQFDPAHDTPESWTAKRAIDRICAMIGVPEARGVSFEVLNIYTYCLSAAVSDRMRKGRLVLVGDSAHRIPPYGGFGLNTGIQSAHNVAWKLAAVLRGHAPEALLDTYDAERREVAARNCDFGRVNAGHIEKLMRAIRAAANTDERRALLSASKQYGNWMGLDVGVHYDGPGAFVPDDAVPPPVANPVIDYVPHGKPGWRAPHLWVNRAGQRLSTISLFDDDFVLLAGPEGTQWIDAARRLSEKSAPAIVAYRVAGDGELIPEGVDFCDLYGISASGAVLVRPDGHVAFRAHANDADSFAALQRALNLTLRRDQATP